jgi:ABC-type multidrug transport system fused ATPase/permease subunit
MVYFTGNYTLLSTKIMFWAIGRRINDGKLTRNPSSPHYIDYHAKERVFMEKEANPKIPIWLSIRRILALSGRNRARLYLALTVAVLETGITIGFNWTLARFLDAVAAASLESFWYYLTLTFALGIVGIPLAYLRSAGVGTFSERTMMTLRTMIATRATVLPMRYLEKRHTGDLLAVVNADLAKVKALTSNVLLDLVAQSLMAVVALVTLFVISWPLALLSTILIPFMLVVMGRLNQPIAQRSEEMQQAIGETVSIAQDGLGGIMVTRAYNLPKMMDGRFRQVNLMALWKGQALARKRAIVDGASFLFGALPFLITFGIGGYLAITGRLSFGSLFMFINLLNYVANPLSTIPSLIASRRGGWRGAAHVPAPRPGNRTGGRESRLACKRNPGDRAFPANKLRLRTRAGHPGGKL